jgi:hypothetical protein
VGANAASTRSFPSHLQIKSAEKNQVNTKLTNKNSNNANSSSNGNDYSSNKSNNDSLKELVNVYNGFNHKFKNETSSIRAYKTIGHTILSFASIISMKNRPLLDNEMISKSPQRKKKGLKGEEQKSQQQQQQQQQKNKINSQLQNPKNNRKQNNDEKSNNNNNNKALPLLQPFSIETISSLNDNNDNNLNNNFKEEPSQENIDQDVKVEIIRTLSICEDGSLSVESLESLKSIDYVKIEDIINEYLVTPTIPEVPTRYEKDNDYLNGLNHLYDAFTYFNNRNLEQYVAWIPINNDKSYLSASSLLAKKHAPFIFKKTITLPKRVSSLYSNYGQSNVDKIKTNPNPGKPRTQPNTTQNKAKITEDRKKNQFKKNQTLSKNPRETLPKENSINSIAKQQESSSKKPSSRNNTQTLPYEPVKSKSLHSKVAESLKPIKSEDNKENVKQQKNKTEIKVKPKSQENKVENKIKPKKQQEKEKNSNPKYQNGKTKQKLMSIIKSQDGKGESKIKPKTQENGSESISNRSKELKNRDYPSLLSPSVSTTDNESNDQIPCKIPILSSSNIDPSNIKINSHKNIPVEFIKNKYSSIPTLDKFEFPFYHMYDAFETYGKPLLRAPRAWRQLKKNVVSIASIYSYDNQP